MRQSLTVLDYGRTHPDYNHPFSSYGCTRLNYSCACFQIPRIVRSQSVCKEKYTEQSLSYSRMVFNYGHMTPSYNHANSSVIRTVVVIIIIPCKNWRNSLCLLWFGCVHLFDVGPEVLLIQELPFTLCTGNLLFWLLLQSLLASLHFVHFPQVPVKTSLVKELFGTHLTLLLWLWIIWFFEHFFSWSTFPLL